MKMNSVESGAILSHSGFYYACHLLSPLPRGFLTEGFLVVSLPAFVRFGINGGVRICGARICGGIYPEGMDGCLAGSEGVILLGRFAEVGCLSGGGGSGLVSCPWNRSRSEGHTLEAPEATSSVNLSSIEAHLLA